MTLIILIRRLQILWKDAIHHFDYIKKFFTVLSNVLNNSPSNKGAINCALVMSGLTYQAPRVFILVINYDEQSEWHHTFEDIAFFF